MDTHATSDQTDLDERSALALLRQGNIAGLEVLVHLHQIRALRTAYAITGDRQAAEDVVADGFLAVYEHIHQLDERRPFAPWFYRIVVNGALKSEMRSARFALAVDDWDLLDDRPDQSPGPEEAAATQELRYLLLTAIYALPPRQRAAMVLRYYLDMDEASIAQILKCPLGTVKWRLYSARRQLRRSLTPQIQLLASET